MERPKPLQADRRFPLWISFLLGMAGVLVTIAGVYELTRERAVTSPSATAPSFQIEDSARRQQVAEQQEAERQAKLREIRERRAFEANQREQALRTGARCLDGVWIIKEGNTIRSAGPCSQ